MASLAAVSLSWPLLQFSSHQANLVVQRDDPEPQVWGFSSGNRI